MGSVYNEFENLAGEVGEVEEADARGRLVGIYNRFEVRLPHYYFLLTLTVTRRTTSDASPRAHPRTSSQPNSPMAAPPHQFLPPHQQTHQTTKNQSWTI